MNAVRAGLDRSKAKSDISSFAPQAIKMQDVSAYKAKIQKKAIATTPRHMNTAGISHLSGCVS